MARERVSRRLAAILAADVVGYSRLIRVDEEATLAVLATLRVELIQPTKLPDLSAGRPVTIIGRVSGAAPEQIEIRSTTMDGQRVYTARLPTSPVAASRSDAARGPAEALTFP